MAAERGPLPSVAPCLRPGCPRPGTELTAIDAHAGGEPGRVIVGGVQDVPGVTMFEKMRHLATFHDDLRLRMLREPRGYPAANCNLVLPPTDPAAAAGFVIMEQVEYPPMSGTNTICVATALIENGMVEVKEPVTSFALETPAGLVRVEVQVAGGKAREVTFENVPCFPMRLDAPLEVSGLGTLSADLAYGGMIYVIADAATLGLRITADEARDLVAVGERIKAAAREQVPQRHPDRPELVGPTIACLVGPASGPHADRRNAVVVSTRLPDGQHSGAWAGVLDRSPCGTGTCAQMATLHARGQLALHQAFRSEGILGTVFTGRLVAETEVAGRRAVVPTITGRAWVTGHARYVLDPEDPFPAGFAVGDTWSAGPVVGNDE
ncbi:MAG TPA: proline racemase family protein [Acidimicrobiales bacterium]|nr:proline racemase family protein [Acidimicrobiales bacterium]